MSGGAPPMVGTLALPSYVGMCLVVPLGDLQYVIELWAVQFM